MAQDPGFSYHDEHNEWRKVKKQIHANFMDAIINRLWRRRIGVTQATFIRHGQTRLGTLAMLLALFLTSCGEIDRLTQTFEKTANTIEGIGADFSNRAADFNSTANRLTDVLKDLPKEAGTELRVAVEQVAQRAAQDASIQAMCLIDFARNRIAQDIKYLVSLFRARAHKQKDPERPVHDPYLCDPSPSSVRRDRLSQNGIIVFNGYDFPSVNGNGPKLSVALERQNGQQVKVDILSIESPYKVVADMSRVQAQLDATVRRLLLLSGTHVLSQVVIEQPPQSVRRTLRAELSPWGPKVAGPCGHPRNPHANRDFSGGGPKVDWSVRLSISPRATQLIAHIHYHAIEWDRGGNHPRSDFTEACGDWDEVVYSVPTGQRIVRIVDDGADSGSYVDTNLFDDFASGNLYTRYVLGGDSNGDDVSVSTKIKAPEKGQVQIEVEIPPQ